MIAAVFRRRFVASMILGLAILDGVAVSTANSQPPAGDTIGIHQSGLDLNSPRRLVQYAASGLLRHLPSVFEGDKDWCQTKKVFDGVEIKFRDGRLRTHRRWKDVDHGRWIRYRIELPGDGLRLNRTVYIDRVVAATPPMTGYEMDVRIDTPIQFEIQMQRHVRGVKVSSVTVQGHARVVLETTTLVDTYSDITEIPPAMVIDPKILEAKLKLESFEVDRVSHIGGDVAEAWGEIAQETLVKIAVERQNEKLADRLRTAIEKNRDDLRFSTRDFIRQAIPIRPIVTSPLQHP